MECNKEEAIRAKGIAEHKMQNNDFAAARKIALKAQQLYHDLENISQMIMVCDVLCSAENKLLGNEMDWYGILKVQQIADEVTIKKQYRKFALQLHPDKNKFPGAETAFKLIGEAQRVLLDKGKRSLHDMKHKASVSRPAAPYQHPQRPTFSNVGMQNNFSSTFSGVNFQPQKQQQPAQPGIFNGGQAFWTMCPFCTVRYQYYRHLINKPLTCQACKKLFVAYEMGEQGNAMASNLGQPAFRQQKDVPSQGSSKVERVFKGNCTADNPKTVFSQKAGCTSGCGKEKVNGKRGRKQVVESSGSCSTESSSDSESDLAVDENGDFQGGEHIRCYADQYPRRSSRRKQQVSYKENLSDDDDLVTHSKRAKGSGSSCAAEVENGDASKEEAPKTDKLSGSATAVKKEQKESVCSGESLANVNKETRKVTGKEIVEDNGCQKNSAAHADGHQNSSEAIADSTSDADVETAEPELYHYPDPDFNDFDKDRKEECFKVGQTWALYDTIDAMPRFYARIRKVFSSGFKLRIMWLESDPDDEKEIEWVNKGLPFSCGKFKHGHSENTEDRLMFSHLVSWEKGRGRDTYKIFPRKGEIWGLFRGWDYNWISDADSNRKYDYKFVEILSDYAEGVGIYVAYLAKVKGFASVFCRKNKEGVGSVQIPPGELLRFSHRVPSFKLTGEEREGLLTGSFELDPASLPLNLEEIAVSEILRTEAGCIPSNCSLRSSDKGKPAMGSEGCTSRQQNEVKETRLEPEDDSLGDDVETCSAPPASTPEAIEILRTEVGCIPSNCSLRSSDKGKPAMGSEGCTSRQQNEVKETSLEPEDDSLGDDVEHCSAPPASTPEAIEIPDPEFYNFDAEKSEDKLEVGQIWSLYSDEDGLPKYYGQIVKIESDPAFKLHLRWLESCSLPENSIRWHDEDMLICCGTFKVKTDESDEYTSTVSFSHQVRAQPAGWTNEYTIFPRKGEVWALYRNWSAEIKSSDLENCEYDIVEVCEANDLLIEVLFLEHVTGFNSVFKPQERGSAVMNISLVELLRFSHQIPAIKLTEEKDGTLRGFWELDPAALPVHYFLL